MRQISYDYEEKVREEVLTFVNRKISSDYLQGDRALDLDLSVREAQNLYNANEEIRQMAESGELQAFHQRYNDTLQAVEGGYLRVMDQLDRALNQISEAENDIYEDMRETEGLERLKAHGDASLVDVLAFSGDTAMENYILVSGVA